MHMSEPGMKLAKLLQRVLNTKPGTEIKVQVTIELQNDMKRALQIAESAQEAQRPRGVN